MVFKKEKVMAYLLRICGYILHYSGLYHLLDRIFFNKGIYILMYHRIADEKDDYYDDDIAVKRREFIKQLRFFRKKYCCISMSAAVSMINKNTRLKKNYIVFTFDDGYLDNMQYGLNLFRQFKINPIIYITANKIETNQPLWTETVDRLIFRAGVPYLDIDINGIRLRGRLDSKKACFDFAHRVKAALFEAPQWEIHNYLIQLQKKLGAGMPHGDNALLAWSDVKALLRAGCEIGSHTMNHVNCAIESGEVLSNEIEDSRRLIEKRTHKKVEHFSYPFGKQMESFQMGRLVHNHYASAVTIVEGINKCASDVYRLKRIKIANHHSLLDIRTKLLKVKIIDLLQMIKNIHA
jgi:peptidoglycan/xylan/chitin deacetylase (PgdA/CDA1 family)